MDKRPSEIAVKEWWKVNGNYKSKRMENLNINGKIIKTNFGACDYIYWDGNGGGYRSVPFRKSTYEVFDELVAAGYNYIKFVYTTTAIRGYHNIHYKAERR